MIIANKKVGETPLEMLDRLRLERPELAGEKLSYAGRLDPMAEGAMLILVGEKENQDRQKYLGLEKEYSATFLIGVKTDSGDILGLIENLDSFSAKVSPSESEIQKTVEKFTEIQNQVYPWFSGQTVDGVKLFDHFKAGNTEIERPSLDVKIRESKVEVFESLPVAEVKKYILESVRSVRGDFRQSEILRDWEDFFESLVGVTNSLQTFKVHISVSSGTFIRALNEQFDFPVTLLRLKRTKICLGDDII